MFQISPIPAFQDNYLWLIENDTETWIVDPGDATPVIKTLQDQNKKLSGILITHHHPDHIGGVEELYHPGLQVIGPKKDQFKLVNDPVSEGDVRQVCGAQFKVIEVPGHTLNHLAFFCEPEEQEPVLFCGDTLFAAGCGRLFEGTPKQMYHSLSRLMSLPGDTQIYCAHEYTEANLKFALSVEPGNNNIVQRAEAVAELRSQGIPSVPSNIKVEKATNPFLRTSSAEIISNIKAKMQSAGTLSQTEVFTQLRKMKDVF
jgi:hydroxyacylglutathione hydrolase